MSEPIVQRAQWRCAVACALLALGMGFASARNHGGPSSSFIIGICAPPEEPVFHDLSIRSYRQDLSWAASERTVGHFELPAGILSRASQWRKAYLKPLNILDYGNPSYDHGLFPISDTARQGYVHFAVDAAEALGDPRGWFEIWNEWNWTTGMPRGTRPGDPGAYVRLLKDTYTALKKRYPDSLVLGGAMGQDGKTDDWLRRACDAGMLGSLDGLSFHPYGFSNFIASKRMPEERMQEQLVNVERTIAPYEKKLGRQIPFYVTEIGWPSITPDGVSEYSLQARYLARGLLLLRANPRVRGVWLFTLHDFTEDNPAQDFNLGLLHADGSPKPVYAAACDILRLIHQTTSASACVGLASDTDGQVQGVKFIAPDGRAYFAVWCREPDESWKVILRLPKATSDLRQWIAGGRESAVPVPAQCRGDYSLVSLSVQDMPLLVGPLASSTQILEGATLR